MKAKMKIDKLADCSKLNYKYMSFEGGGAKGYAYIGALDIILKTNMIQNLKGFAGVSAGSIPAVMLAIDMNYEKIATELTNMDFSKFKDDTFGFGRDIWRLLHKYGLYKGKIFIDWFEDILFRNTGTNNITFAQAYRKTKKHLIVVATDYTNGKLKIFSYSNTPNASISLAVRASIAIPFVFVPVVYKGHILVDGGTLCNYYVFPEELGKTLGLYLISNDEYSVKDAKPKSFKDYLARYIDLFQYNLEKRYVPEEQWSNTIKIPTKGISATDFNLSTDDKEFLIKSGKISTFEFLKKNGVLV